MTNAGTQQYDLEERLINFAVLVIGIAEALPGTRTGTHIAGQLLRSGTAPAAHYAEAQSAESRDDFIHKMKLSLKELRETRIWLRIVSRKALIQPPEKAHEALAECEELIRIFVKSIVTAESKRKSS